MAKQGRKEHRKALQAAAEEAGLPWPPEEGTEAEYEKLLAPRPEDDSARWV